MLTLTPIVSFGLALLIAFVSTPFVRRLALRIGAIDRRADDKIHDRDIPRLGGVAIAIAFYVPLLGLALRANQYQSSLYHEPMRLVALLGGGAAILGLGIYDDLKRATAAKKLLVQVPVAVLAWMAGIRIGVTSWPAGNPLVLVPIVSLGVTVIWIVVVMNAVNLIDGLDGLASGIALLALVATAVCAWHRGEPMLALVAICLAGAVTGFLGHNFHPATIFMGDSGSLFLGYVLATASIWSSQKAVTAVGVVLPMLTLAIPVLDTSWAITRRLIRGRKIMSGDLEHIHHRVLSIGWSQKKSVLLLYAVAALFSALSVALVLVHDPTIEWLVLGVALLAAWGFVVWLRRIHPILKVDVATVRRRNLAIRRAVATLEDKLQNCSTQDELLEAIDDFRSSLSTEFEGKSAAPLPQRRRVIR